MTVDMKNGIIKILQIKLIKQLHFRIYASYNKLGGLMNYVKKESGIE